MTGVQTCALPIFTSLKEAKPDAKLELEADTDANLGMLVKIWDALREAGYSINDKVVVFDRVREIFRSARKLGPEETINKAVNNTLSRTIITGITTFFALFSLYFLGGPVVEGFAMTVIFGIVVGTLSSIFFCNPILMWLGVSKSDLQTVRKEDPELALRP